MTNYLYGAAVQGIQNFIFQTNNLQEIVGASELVEEICTELFKEIVGEKEYETNTVLHAAGNIKHIFTSRKACEDVVRVFPKKALMIKKVSPTAARANLLTKLPTMSESTTL